MQRFKRVPHSTASIWVATFLGGPLAAAWLARRNRLAAADVSNHAYWEIVLWVAGVAAIWISYSRPPDVLSQLLSAGLFSYLMVGLWLALSPSSAEATGNPASIWYAVGIGLLTNFAISGFLWKLVSASSVVREACSAWARAH